MNLPFNEKLLYDKKFTNIAQAVLKKAMMQGPKNIYYDKYGKPLVDLNQIYTVGLENQIKILEMQNLLPARRKTRPITSETDRFKYFRQKVDVLDQPWYDEPCEPKPGYPEKYEYAKIQKLGGDPVPDNRLHIIKKWRRPLSADKNYSEWQKKQLALQKGKNLKTLMGQDQIRILKQNQKYLKKNKEGYEPE